MPAASYEKVYAMPFSKVYPLYLAKAEKKGRSKEEVDQIIFWLTGYEEAIRKVQEEHDSENEKVSYQRE